MAMKVLVDKFIVLAIEKCLLKPLSIVISLEMIIRLANETV